ncbi:tRNA (adenosine(37)-N6)-threonylcarbamoyltransferase complex ATPase subunit type 1 TsaE [Lutibacter sp. B2]|nr:tRNA (adenosine(37)-N6)-threonylcarbamoyltransferase complex ATPase subunit type 1 TsaE [Lutibacter sp. B2]
MISNNEQKTYDLGYKLGTLLKKGDIICLTGDLGAGKTAMSKAIAKGLEVDEHVTSPTFSIIQEYMGRLPLYHFDVYRIGSVEEMEDLGYEEYFYGDGVCIIEWASIIEEIIPKEHLWIDIKRDDHENIRKIEMKATTEHFKNIIEELKKI